MVDHPKIDPSICSGCSYGDVCELIDPNDGNCRRYEDLQLFCEYQAEELRENGYRHKNC